MLELLRESGRSVSDLSRPFSISQPAISQHLKVLREAGLVHGSRAGRRRIYRLDPQPLRRVYEWASRYFADPAGHVWGISAVAGPDRGALAADFREGKEKRDGD